MKRQLIEPEHPALSLRRQCELLGLNRSNIYYQPVPESPLNLILMRLIDEQYLKTPFYGYLKMTAYLRQIKHYKINHKRVYRLMRRMGLRSVAPRPNRRFQPGTQDLSISVAGCENHASQSGLEHGHHIHSNGTRIHTQKEGQTLYLVAVIDWYSRYVLSWEISNTLDGDFCLTALEQAFEYGTPEIFNTDHVCPGWGKVHNSPPMRSPDA